LKQVFFLLVVGIIAVCCYPHVCGAQTVGDTVAQKNSVTHTSQAEVPQSAGDADNVADTVVDSVALAKARPFQPNPKKAGLYSALVPGLGQLYNRQYWKIPVVYAGLGVCAYFLVTNYKSYESYYTAYVGRIANPYPTDKYVGVLNTAQLQQYANDDNKYLDITALCTVVGYALQVLDAVTGAHLKNFDISRDISMKVQPVAMPNGIGLGLVMNIK